jgi:hypothetical protein
VSRTDIFGGSIGHVGQRWRDPAPAECFAERGALAVCPQSSVFTPSSRETISLSGPFQPTARGPLTTPSELEL